MWEFFCLLKIVLQISNLNKLQGTRFIPNISSVWNMSTNKKMNRLYILIVRKNLKKNMQENKIKKKFVWQIEI